MTPEEAANFYEPDEDAEALFAKFDAATKSVTVAPVKLVPATQTQPSNYIAYTAEYGLYGELRRGLFPETVASRSNSQQAVQG